MADLTMDRGEDRTVVFTFDGASTFEAGDAVRFTIKNRNSDPDGAAVLTLSSVGGGITLAGTTATANIPAAATEPIDRPRKLLYDWQLTTAAGKTRTIDKGTVTVLPDITRST